MNKERIGLYEDRPAVRGNGHDTAPPIETRPERNLSICGFCRNSLREICLESCSPSKKYLALSPKPLETIPFLPSLPPFVELKRWSPEEKQAINYLVLWYLLAQEKENRRR